MTEETSYKRTIIAVILTVFITAAIVVAGMYVWSNTFMQAETDQNTEKIEDVEDTINDLEDKVDELEKEISSS